MTEQEYKNRLAALNRRLAGIEQDLDMVEGDEDEVADRREGLVEKMNEVLEERDQLVHSFCATKGGCVVIPRITLDQVRKEEGK